MESVVVNNGCLEISHRKLRKEAWQWEWGDWKMVACIRVLDERQPELYNMDRRDVVSTEGKRMSYIR